MQILERRVVMFATVCSVYTCLPFQVENGGGFIAYCIRFSDKIVHRGFVNPCCESIRSTELSFVKEIAAAENGTID